MSGALGAEIVGLIRETGPIGIDRYMALCLAHPVHGYYRTRDPLGPRGDFTTAPEISQMFGELIGIWIALVREAMGAPERLTLVELGPGRGTLASDALRALGSAACGARFDLHLVETSPTLRAAQGSALQAHAPTWHEGIDTLPEGPAIVIANEFFDCLPVRQFQRTAGGWCERVVGLDGDRLAFGLAPEPASEITALGPEGVLMTVPGAGLDLMRRLARRLAAQGGALLAIDYGHARPGFGDTLQALARHAFVDPLADPGGADLTAHVDFSALGRAASAEGAAVHGPVDQRDFLRAMGLDARAERLKAKADAAQAAAIDAARTRLTDPGRRGMGSLFKAMGVAAPGLPLPALG
ncbi:class I SAM-dependent methyltransferase [Methylobacterium dankookense]|uniref:ATP synthase subunit beta n=1 Tax=Methylobacterium dankookense TaxID=560405 RepID=A0A564FYN2_9HYPH|nr:SAM-dependent methyltransferase [Methylobacterium dankookense]GJD59769.1 hypothetical protein IFDJLNFL_5700 [Methylobacterium dankookense]VUF12838.1 hypothetical protein MTDSW087_02533 [Methylobacterium dankookense]